MRCPGTNLFYLRQGAFLLLLAGFILSSGYSAPAKTSAPTTARKTPSIRSETPSVAPIKPDSTDLPIAQWPGKRFIFLRMPPQYRQFGYELYTSEKLSASSLPIAPGIELPNHRLSYEKFCGKIVTVRKVLPMAGEYLISFSDTNPELTLWAKTRNGAIKGLALVDELESARTRWVGRTIWSHRGHINTADSSAALIKTETISIRSPLRVTGVVRGVSPMPPQMLWIVVETPDKKSGFIPTFYSWTNVMNDSRKSCRPWQEDILEQDPARLCPADPATWEMIENHHIGIEMTTDQIWLSWGEPSARESVSREGRTAIRWSYPGQFIYFTENKATEIENR